MNTGVSHSPFQCCALIIYVCPKQQSQQPDLTRYRFDDGKYAPANRVYLPSLGISPIYKESKVGVD